MPSLVIDARMIDASGIGVYLRNIIPHLISSFNITLLGDLERFKGFEWAEQVKMISVNSPIYSLQEQKDLFTSIPACDLFWSPHYNIPLLPIRAKKRIATIHDTYHLAYKHTLNLPQKAFATLFLNAAVRLSDHVLTVSGFSKGEIVKYTKVRQEKITVIPNGVRHDVYKKTNSGSTKGKLKDLLPGLPNSFILYVGNVKPHKNLKTLLKAYAALPAALQHQYKLVITGKKEGFITPDSDLSLSFRDNPGLEAKTFFTGYVPDEILPSLYNSASLFVFPSVYEGFGLPPLEAMACGCPVVASTAASIREVCGEAALYFPPLDWQELSQQMEKVLTQETFQEKLVKLGYNQSRQYSWNQAAIAHQKVFLQVLAST